ncbi:MAG: sulfotransferase [Terricaulis sp.]
MFFCFGSPRSGTTLISQSIGAHPDIVVPAETDFIIPAAFIYDRIRDPEVRRPILQTLITQSAAFPRSLGEYLSAGDIGAIIAAHDALPDLIDAIYAALAHKAGAGLAGDKSPNDLNFIRILDKTKALPPSARVIHIVRDVRDVVAAVAVRRMWPGIETQFARMWSASNLYLHTWLKHDPRYLLVKYEDFVAAPRAEITRMLAHLGHSYADATLDPAQRHPRLKHTPSHEMLYEPIAVSRVGAYRDACSPELIALCETQAREAMQTFGYQRDLAHVRTSAASARASANKSR